MVGWGWLQGWDGVDLWCTWSVLEVSEQMGLQMRAASSGACSIGVAAQVQGRPARTKHDA